MQLRLLICANATITDSLEILKPVTQKLFDIRVVN